MALDIVNWVLRIVEFVFSVIVLALTSAMVAQKPDGQGTSSQVNYLIFASVFSLLTWFYSVITVQWFTDNLGAPVIILALDLLNTLFYFCGGIALAAALGVHSCGDPIYLATNGITNGIVDGKLIGSAQLCHEGQAATAFAWFLFAIYLVSTILVGISGGVSTSRVKSRMPAMSHV